MFFEEENIDEIYTKLHLEETVHRNHYFQNCQFIGCHFTQAHLIACVFEECHFERCDLSLVQVQQSSFIGTTFSHCKLMGINWTVAGQRLQLSFDHCNLNHNSFSSRSLPDFVMTHCSAHHVNFSEAKLPKANLKHSDFQDARFNKTDLSGADVSHATNYAINVIENTIKQATFSVPEALSLLNSFNIKIV